VSGSISAVTATSQKCFERPSQSATTGKAGGLKR
jgi:hypothetical protein